MHFLGSQRKVWATTKKKKTSKEGKVRVWPNILHSRDVQESKQAKHFQLFT